MRSLLIGLCALFAAATFGIWIMALWLESDKWGQTGDFLFFFSVFLGAAASFAPKKNGWK